jgi:GTP-binding protein HflX
LLHVVDITHPNAQEQVKAVHETLRTLKIVDIPMVTALNKIDRLAQPVQEILRSTWPHTVLISAMEGPGLTGLLQALEDALYRSMVPVRVHLPFQAGRLLNIFHMEGTVDRLVTQSNGVTISGRLPPTRLSEFRPYFISSGTEEKSSS